MFFFFLYIININSYKFLYTTRIKNKFYNKIMMNNNVNDIINISFNSLNNISFNELNNYIDEKYNVSYDYMDNKYNEFDAYISKKYNEVDDYINKIYDELDNYMGKKNALEEQSYNYVNEKYNELNTYVDKTYVEVEKYNGQNMSDIPDYYINENLNVYDNNYNYLSIPLTHTAVVSHINKDEEGYEYHIRSMLKPNKPIVVFSNESVNNYKNLVELYNMKWSDVKEIIKVEDRYRNNI